jgi:pimeloyl-ACP methyl ester carboxylesterase
MSVFTEKSDLEAVIEMIKGLDFVDNNNLFLLGSSQGGMVSAMTAAGQPNAIRGLILLYPAFVISDSTRQLYQSIDEIPDVIQLMWMQIGRRYYEDIWNYDVYEHIGAYNQDVLIIHGDRDELVPVSFSERAVEVYPSAELKVIAGAGHGFQGNDAETAIGYMLDYIGSKIN